MTFTASDVLLKAASRIEEEGMWCQREWFKGHSGLAFGGARIVAREGLRRSECVEGAIASAAIDLLGDAGYGLYVEAMSIFEAFLGPNDTAIDFNDADGRTAHEVAEALRRAAL